MLLVDVYDMVAKYEAGYEGNDEKYEEEETQVELIENEQKESFYRYLMETEKIGEKELF